MPPVHLSGGCVPLPPKSLPHGVLLLAGQRLHPEVQRAFWATARGRALPFSPQELAEMLEKEDFFGRNTIRHFGGSDHFFFA